MARWVKGLAVLLLLGASPGTYANSFVIIIGMMIFVTIVLELFVASILVGFGAFLLAPPGWRWRTSLCIWPAWLLVTSAMLDHNRYANVAMLGWTIPAAWGMALLFRLSRKYIAW